MENPANQPIQPVNPPPPTTQPDQSQKQRSKIPLLVGILFVLCIAGVGVYYVGMKNTKPSQVDQLIPTPTTTSVTQPTQIPENAVFRLPVNGKHLEIHANALKNTDNIPITSIRSYDVSPDKTKLALLADDGSNALFLYVTDINGENAIFVGSVPKDSTLQWSVDNQSISADSPSGKQLFRGF